MSDFLTEKLLLNTQHGMDCTVEVCKPTCPDDDKLIFQGAAGDCLRCIMEYKLPYDGESYFSFTTNQDNYVGYNFDEVAILLGFKADILRDMLGGQQSVDGLIQDAAGRAGAMHKCDSVRDMEF